MEHNALVQRLLPFTLFNVDQGYVHYNCYATNAIILYFYIFSATTEPMFRG